MDKVDRKVWTEEEDKILIELINLHGAKNWALISKEFSTKYGIHTKIGKQCRERWNNNLNPSLIKGPWTAKEEKILFDLHKIHGNKWSQIALELKGRTDNSTKNHFYTIVRKNLRKYNKTVPESKQLKGDIKDLLKNPENNKILLKKPGHYYQKKGAKKTSSESSSKKSSKRASRSSLSQFEGELVKPGLEKIKFRDDKATKAVIKVRRSSTRSSIPGDITPGSEFNRLSITTIDNYNESTGILPSPRDIYSYQASARSSNISITARLSQVLGLNEVYPKTPRLSCNGRNTDRAGSFISSEGFNFSRRGSRNNTNESLEVPAISRKQSTKVFDEKNYTGIDNDKLPNLPPYLIENTFKFNKTPRSSRNLI